MTNTSWEPTYGFCGGNLTANETLARTLEAIRRSVCCYGGGDRCDCKYGLGVEDTLEHQTFGLLSKRITGTRYDSKLGNQVTMPHPGGEQTGCPELRELISRLMHRPGTFGELDDYDKGYQAGTNAMRENIQSLLEQFGD